MILELHVESIAIIDRSSLSLQPGFTVLTGETGAGKSLLVDAITLALGGRADSDLVRSGATRGTVSLLADVSRLPDVLTRCTELGVVVEDGQIAVQRDLTAKGRSTVWLNGRPVSVNQLREIGNLLVDLHGQHDHQALLVPERQIEFFDRWIGDEAQQLLSAVSDLYVQAEALKRRLAQLQSSRRDREQRVDMLHFQIQDIEQVAPRIGEAQELAERMERLKNADRLRILAHESLTRLCEDEGSAEERLGTAVRGLEAAATLDPGLEDTLEHVKEASAVLREATMGLRSYVDGLDSDPEALEQAAERLDAIRRLMRKYGDSEQSVLDHLATAKEELANLTDDSTTEAEVQRTLTVAQEALEDRCASLSRLRVAKAKEFGQLVEGHLRDLAMEQAQFTVEIEPKPVDAAGADSVCFLFSANEGEPAKSLSRVASGGEISRVMLAIKVASAGRAGVPTLVFDEVDTGLSGKAAAVTANKLHELSRYCQVVAISHLPQLAAKADHHFRIEKAVSSGRATTQVVALEGEDRVREVARMLAGELISESAMANAREMVAGRA